MGKMLKPQEVVESEVPCLTDDCRREYDAMVDPVKAIAIPRAYGVAFGLKWATMADLKDIKLIAEIQTTNEQLRDHLESYAECEAKGEEADGNIAVISPVNDDACFSRCQEAFFRWAMDAHPAFQGLATSEDPEITHPFEGGGCYFVSDVPNSKFRAFEDGWASAVREYYEAAKSK